MGKVLVEAWSCDVCGYVWLANRRVTVKEEPRICPRCSTRRWNTGAPQSKDQQAIGEESAKEW